MFQNKFMIVFMGKRWYIALHRLLIILTVAIFLVLLYTNDFFEEIKMVFYILIAILSIFSFCLPAIYNAVKKTDEKYKLVAKDNVKIYVKRLSYAFTYWGLGAYILIITIMAKVYFMAAQGNDISESAEATIRFFYCVGAVYGGFFFKAFNYRVIPVHPYPKYVIEYPCVLTIFSLLAFLVISAILEKQDFIYVKDDCCFYLLALPVSFILSFFVDDIIRLGK